MKPHIILLALAMALSGCTDALIIKHVVIDGARNGNGGFSNKAVKGKYCPQQRSSNVIEMVPC